MDNTFICFSKYIVFGICSCYSIFSFICMFCRSLFVLLYIYFWSLCCLFFDIHLLPFCIETEKMTSLIAYHMHAIRLNRSLKFSVPGYVLQKKNEVSAYMYLHCLSCSEKQASFLLLGLRNRQL
jgi:hypothetical protein